MREEEPRHFFRRNMFMRISRCRSLCVLSGFVLVGGAAIVSKPVPSEAQQTIECFVRVCKVYANGDRECFEKKISCDSVRPLVE